MITIHRLNDFKLGNALYQVANMIGYATLHGFEFGLAEPWRFQDYFQNPLPILKRAPTTTILQESQFNYYTLPVEDDIALSGYWQSPERFQHCMDLVRHYCKFSGTVTRSASSKLQLLPDTVALHVRLTDYKDFSRYHTNLQDTMYYSEAMTYVRSELGITKMFMCSDDIKYCVMEWNQGRKWSADYGIRFCLDSSSIDDFFHLTRATTTIIANSSFSAFAALLNTKQNKKVIAPKAWFAEKGPQQWDSVYHPDWIVI